MDQKEHWEAIYSTKAPTEVSWYQNRPVQSLEMIRAAGLGREASVIDVGGGASLLADCLLAEGYRHLTVLDLSGQALEKAKERLGKRSNEVAWIEADITRADLPAD